MPFRKQLKAINGARYGDILKNLRRAKLKCYAIDDSQYLLAFEFFDRAVEKGYDKFTQMAVNFRELIQFVVEQTPPDCIVYFLHHTDSAADGTIKAKTIGKMLDEKLTVEGLFSIVLLCRSGKDRHYFQTQSEGMSTAKSPMEMFELEIDNDLKAVDAIIREYWWLAPITENKEGTENG